MKNKVELKKCLFRIALAVLLFLGIFTGIHTLEYQKYTRNCNETVNAILAKVRERYPEVSEAELMEILNSEQTGETSFVRKYGIDLDRDSLILKNNTVSLRFLWILLTAVLLLSLVIGGLFFWYNQKKDRELEKITRYIEELNRKNYRLEIEDMSEDELSILKSEVYKTTVMLKETAENSLKDKENLKQSLSDISHQLKTPLTSISVVLDNLIDDPEMDAEVRMEFVRIIKREITNINFLVQSLLKLSKLESSTVPFFRERISVEALIKEAVQNVNILCDLKNICLDINYQENVEFTCDLRWQAEAVTNILKNAVEHAPCDSRIQVNAEQNQMYTAISIRDFGPGIDAEDQKHLFERFYRGKYASENSIGIGLSLAKAIVENDRGRIFVDSHCDGTTFTIKYFC